MAMPMKGMLMAVETAVGVRAVKTGAVEVHETIAMVNRSVAAPCRSSACKTILRRRLACLELQDRRRQGEDHQRLGRAADRTRPPMLSAPRIDSGQQD